jgi:hypothetical protein
LNWSHQHPKLEGYQATPRTLFIFSTQEGRKGRKASVEWYHFIDEISMRDNHPAAAVSAYAKGVKDLLGCLSHLHSLDINFI